MNGFNRCSSSHFASHRIAPYQMATMIRFSFSSIRCKNMLHSCVIYRAGQIDGVQSVSNKTMDVSNSSALKRFVISSSDDNDNSDFGFDYYRLKHPFNPLLMCGRVKASVSRSVMCHSALRMEWHPLLIVNPAFQSMMLYEYLAIIALSATFSSCLRVCLNAYRFSACPMKISARHCVLFPVRMAILSEFCLIG